MICVAGLGIVQRGILWTLALYNTVAIFHAPDNGKRIISTSGETGGAIETPEDKTRDSTKSLICHKLSEANVIFPCRS
jgi:hypothetical protein